ncbi:hypothetical protein F4814DRAFT_432099 [Daldinia grandis]|nr:hypothetical protein F4814DRAFT_432099 [Daldinia grandis]
MQMPSANGFIKSVAGGSKFSATFVIDEVQYHYSGNFNPSVQAFESNEAVLEYGYEGQLTTQRQLEGKVGTQDIDIIIKNGPTIKGLLNMPINPATRVSGTGTWAQN